MSREDTLLKEYEVCQQDSSSMVSAHWTVVGIFIGINTALLGAVAYLLNGAPANHVRWIVVALGLFSLGVFASLWRWLNRVNSLVRANEQTMRWIETCLGMKHRCKPQGDGSCAIKTIYMLFKLLWIAAIVAAYIFDC